MYSYIRLSGCIWNFPPRIFCFFVLQFKCPAVTGIAGIAVFGYIYFATIGCWEVESCLKNG